MITLLPQNQSIIFEPIEHSYKKDGKQLISITTLIELYSEPFDPQGHITQACARREKISAEEMRKRWRENGERAAKDGHNLHSSMEYFINNKKIRNDKYKKIVKQFSKIKFKGDLYSEILLCDVESGIAGTCDLLSQLDEKHLELYDFKYIKRFDLKSRYKKNLLYPLNNIGACHLNKYSLQLYLYKYILEKNGYTVTNIPQIFYINSETHKIETIETINMEKDIKKLLNHYKSVIDF